VGRAKRLAFGIKEKTMSKFLKLIKNSKGATAIEYGLIAALIAVAAIGAMQGIGTKLSTTFNNVSNSLR
jgi:pilus assembly protein Flp/PilA